MRRFILAAFAFTVLAACQPAANELTEEQKAEIVAEVELVHGQWVDAWKAADVERGMSFFLDAPELAEVVDGELTIGFSTIRDGWTAAFGEIASQTLTLSGLQTMVLAPDVVCATEQGTYAVTDTAGVTRPEVSYAYTAIWVRVDGEWKIHYGHQSSPTAESQ